jgi:tetratricopeptide (TPR) repeat protein
MSRILLLGAVIWLPLSAWAQDPRNSVLTQEANSRMAFGATSNQYLVAGAHAMLGRQYEEGIRLTKLGLQRPGTDHEHAAGFSNLCAAYAATMQIELAIAACTQSIEIDDTNWRAYGNRSYAYYLKGAYAQANKDLEVAAGINPAARQLAQIRGMVNEKSLLPSVTTEEHPLELPRR